MIKIQKEKVKNREIIVNNKIVFSTIKHPDEAKINKNFVFKLFLKSLGDNSLLISEKNEIYEIKINGKIFNFIFNTVDSGGRESTVKTAIPFAKKNFKSYIENSLEPIFIVHVYRNLNSNFKVEENNTKIVWLIISPTEIYESKSFLKKTFNDSSRWFKIKDIHFLMNNKGFLLNDVKNVYGISDESLSNFFEIKNELLEEYSSMLNFNASNFLDVKDKNDEYNFYSKTRSLFRKKLLINGNELNESSVITENLLIASHIKPVHEIKGENISDDDKINQICSPDNGILIPFYFDYLFDKHYISISENNELLVPKKRIDNEYNELLKNINSNNVLKSNKYKNSYMKLHREKTIEKRGNLELYKA